MSVREENEEKNSCSGRGVGLAAAAVGVGIGIGAAIYYFFRKHENETPSNVGSTHRQNWQSEPLHALLNKEDSQYTTLSEHTTTDTSMNDSDMSYSSVVNDSYTTINDGISDNDCGNNDFYDTEDSDRSNDNVSENSNQEEEEENASDLESDEESHEIDGDITDDDTNSENSDSDDKNSDISVTDDEVIEISDESNQDAEDSYSIISSVRDEVNLSSIEISDTEYSFAEVDDNNPGSDNENSPDGSLGQVLNENVNLGANNGFWASTYDSLSEVRDWLVFTLATVAIVEAMSDNLDGNQIPVPNNTPVAASRRTGLYDNFFKKKLARNEEEKLKAFRERSWTLEECSICFDVMLKDQELMTLPCTHNFHQHCILPWLQEKHTCPNCRLVAE